MKKFLFYTAVLTGLVTTSCRKIETDGEIQVVVVNGGGGGSIAAVITATERSKVRRRPSRSPIWPKTMAPNGRRK